MLFEIASNNTQDSGLGDRNRTIRLRILSQSLACLCVFGGAIAFRGVEATATQIIPTPTTKQLLPRRKFYQGFEANPDYCDTRNIRGWFYWYVDSSERCTIVIVANREEAIRQSRELFDNSFSIVIAGFGVKN